MKVKRKMEYGKVHQVGQTNYAYDVMRKALKPGVRMSKDGKRYYEYRKNRSDMKGGV